MDERREQLRVDILKSLKHNPEHPPVFLTDAEAALVLKQTRNTLSKWRCTGRHVIPYTKLGRGAVYYRVPDLIDFILEQTQEVADV